MTFPELDELGRGTVDIQQQGLLRAVAALGNAHHDAVTRANALAKDKLFLMTVAEPLLAGDSPALPEILPVRVAFVDGYTRASLERALGILEDIDCAVTAYTTTTEACATVGRYVVVQPDLPCSYTGASAVVAEITGRLRAMAAAGRRERGLAQAYQDLATVFVRQGLSDPSEVGGEAALAGEPSDDEGDGEGWDGSLQLMVLPPDRLMRAVGEVVYLRSILFDLAKDVPEEQRRRERGLFPEYELVYPEFAR
jgi:hypothetical protein